MILVYEVYASVIGKTCLPLRLTALLAVVAAVSTASAGSYQLVAAGAMLDSQQEGAGTPTKKSTTGEPSVAKQSALFRQKMKDSHKAFLSNGGQWPAEALYVAQSPNLNLWVTDKGLRTEYYANYVQKGQTLRKGQVIDMSLVGGKANSFEGVNPLPGITQFINGGKKAVVRTARSFEEVQLKSVLSGVDMRVYNEGDRPRYDLVVAPGADVASIKMKFKGASSVKLDEKGNLALGTKNGDLEHRGLFVYQMVDGVKQEVKARFTNPSKDVISFSVDSYDQSKPLVIDPIVYGTYFGGDQGMDEVRAVAADSDAGIFFTGSTQAPDFPILFGPFGVNLQGASDTFIVKLRGDAYVHEYSAYVGGTGRETGKFIAVDPTGNTIWIAGTTTSANFPMVTGTPFQGALAGATDSFLIGFKKDLATVLAPVYSTYYGSAAGTESLTGFAIAPVTGDLVISGHASAAEPGTGAPPSASSHFISRFAVTTTPTYSITQSWAKFHGGVSPQVSGFNPGNVASLTGGRTGVTSDTTSVLTGSSVVVDASDNVLITGTVAFAGAQENTATAPTPGYPTTAGVYPSGRFLKFNDAYLAKFDPTGAVVYSATLGGNGFDAGSSLAVDESGNVYVTGIAGSADFPRTTGTFGQTFTSAANVFVTKISTNGSQIVYSTNLRTSGLVFPTGIAINQRGFAFVTGFVDSALQFPQPPGDPNRPSAVQAVGAIFTVDPIRAARTGPTAPDLPTTDGFLTILNSTAEDVLFSTYIGGDLDEVVYAPFVDRVGDVWVMGYVDSYRRIDRWNAAGTTLTRTELFNATGLAAGFITNLAFKQIIESPFGQPTQFTGVAYGSRESPFTGPGTIGNGGGPPPDPAVLRIRDGFLFRFRLDIPLVSNLVLVPSSIAGGLSQQSVGTVTISGPAPAEGVDVVVSLDSTVGASFDANTAVGQQTVTIAPGATTGTFTLFSSPVIDPTQVQVKAEYLGSFKVALLTVNPWLSQLTLTPTTVSSGNTSVGRVTLFAVATEDITVAISTDNPDLISFPNGSTVTIPTGQQSANFPIQTSTVDTQVQGNISASFLGRTVTQNLIVKPAALSSLVLTPNRVAGGGSTIATVTLDGNAPSTGAAVTITVPGNPLNIATAMPVVVNIAAGQRSGTATITSNLVAVNTFSTIRATYNSTTKDATLLIDNISLTSFTITPSTVQGGGNVTGTVVLNQPAPPGGAFVTISVVPAGAINVVDEDTNSAGVQVLVNANATSRSFPIPTVVTTSTINAVVSATRGGVVKNANLTITPVDFTISITPNNILGGNGASLKITLTGVPGANIPISFVKTSVVPNPPDNSGAVTINGGNPTFIPAGSATATFPITTAAVLLTDTVIITGTIGPNSHAANLTVRAPVVTSITFTPAVVRGLTPTTMRVTMDGPAPAGGATVSLNKSPNPQILNLPSTITIPAGDTFADIVLNTNKVSRTLATNVQASYGGGSATGTLTVTR